VTALISVQHLEKSFGPLKAVDDLSLEVQTGEIFGLVGPDGAGKTTAMRLICGALQTGAGEVTIAGISVKTHSDEARAHLGYLPQRFSLYDELTVMENLRFFGEVRGVKAEDWKSRSQEILKFVGLLDFKDRRAGQLSGGMRQKLGLAAALIHRPQVLLLDEPTTGVDPVTRQDFWQLIIREVSSNGVAALVTTPYMDEATRCSRVGFMRRGKILLQGTPDELRQRLQGNILEGRGQPLNLLRRTAGSVEGIRDVQMFGDRLHIRLTHPDEAGQVGDRLGMQFQQAGGTEFLVKAIPPLLEDVFISLVEETEIRAGQRE
jgi:ABC-2 type transport system ATP-binding protein